jgi:hypothetical protein
MAKYKIMRQFIGRRTGDGGYYCYTVWLKRKGIFSKWENCRIFDSLESAFEFVKTNPDTSNIDKPMQVFP